MLSQLLGLSNRPAVWAVAARAFVRQAAWRYRYAKRGLMREKFAGPREAGPTPVGGTPTPGRRAKAGPGLREV